MSISGEEETKCAQKVFRVNLMTTRRLVVKKFNEWLRFIEAHQLYNATYVTLKKNFFSLTTKGFVFD